MLLRIRVTPSSLFTGGDDEGGLAGVLEPPSQGGASSLSERGDRLAGSRRTREQECQDERKEERGSATAAACGGALLGEVREAVRRRPGWPLGPRSLRDARLGRVRCARLAGGSRGDRRSGRDQGRGTRDGRNGRVCGGDPVRIADAMVASGRGGPPRRERNRCGAA
jgi:hypothetical protein